VNPEVRTLASLGDLYLAVGKHALAASLFDMIERLAAGKTTNDRELALFYCDHDRALVKALELAERDLTTRADVYAYDTLAWALYKNRRYEEAGAAMTEALKLGTRDARMYHHAGMIAAARGQSAQARELFERALAIHPAFDLVYAAEAKRMMAELPPIGG
jgi:tetratricopeptide (TPR) repeat protein